MLVKPFSYAIFGCVWEAVDGDAADCVGVGLVSTNGSSWDGPEYFGRHYQEDTKYYESHYKYAFWKL